MSKSTNVKTESLIFQSLTYEVVDMDDDETELSTNQADSDYEYDSDCDNYPQSKKEYKPRNMVIKIYGTTRELDKNGLNKTVYLEVYDFTNHMYLMLPNKYEKTKNELIAMLNSLIDKNIKYCKSSIIIENKIHYRQKAYGFNGGEPYPFLKIIFKNISSKFQFKKIIDDKNHNQIINPHDTRCSQTIPLLNKKRLDIYEASTDEFIRFINNRRLNPAGWIEVSNYKNIHKKTVCNYNIGVSYKNVSLYESDDILPIKVSSFDIECTSGDGSFPMAVRPSDKIIQIGMTTRLFGSPKCYERYIGCLKKCSPIENVSENEKIIVESFATERDLLIGWARYVQHTNPDILIGYNVFGFDWKYLYDRAEYTDCTQLFSILGKIKNQPCKLTSQELKSSALGTNYLYYPELSGRIHIDMLKVIQREHSLPSYKLDRVAYHFMKLNKNDLPPDKIFEYFNDGHPDKIKTIAEYCLQDCILVNDLFDKLNILANCVGMANVCHVPLAILFLRGQGIKTYALLDRELQDYNICYPTLCKIPEEKNDKRDKYEGATVLEPIPGFYYSPITVLDYKSLYPSSMIEKNISLETLVDDPKYLNIKGYIYHTVRYDDKDEKKNVIGETVCIYAEVDDKTNTDADVIKNKGIVPKLLQKLLSARDKSKEMMKKHKGTYMETVYNGLQLAYKIVANSVYGYFGAIFNKLRCVKLAASTTAVGRSRLCLAKELAEQEKGLIVIYGDTDSIFINCKNHDNLKNKSYQDAILEAIKIGQILSRIITSKLGFPQELQYEKTFYPFFILSPKRYGGNKYENDNVKYTYTSMGLVTKRRDNAPIVGEIFAQVIKILFDEKDVILAEKYYNSMINDLFKNNIPIAKLVISKTLKANYKTPTGIAHKVLAERIRDRDPGNVPAVNERVPYVFISFNSLKCCGITTSKTKIETPCKNKLSEERCKCKFCMNLYCNKHIDKHNCKQRCRVCWGYDNLQQCEDCDGY